MDREWFVQHHADAYAYPDADANADTDTYPYPYPDTDPDPDLFIPDLERGSELQPGHGGEVSS